MTDFVWPSDADRAENDELNRVCEHLEAVEDERDQFQRMYHNACASLGAIHEILGCAVVGVEEDAVEELRNERDALKAHCGRLRAALLASTTNAIRVAENMERRVDIGFCDLLRQQAEGSQEVIDRLEGRLGEIRAAWSECGEWPETYSELSALREAIVGADKEAEGLNESD